MPLDFLSQLRRMKYSDSADFMEYCKEYARKNNCTIEYAVSLFKPVCDAREGATNAA